MNILFLDIDGTINREIFNSLSMCFPFAPDCIENLNLIIKSVPRLGIVISSTWRKLIRDKYMNNQGFEFMLRTHGLDYNVKIIGITSSDIKNSESERPGQIKQWVSTNREKFQVEKVVVIDNWNLRNRLEYPFVQTISNIGLTKENAEETIRLFNGG